MVPDVLAKLIIELKADSGVAAIVGNRVAGLEPVAGWAKGPGEYLAFVVLVQLDSPVIPGVPVQRSVIVARCYGGGETPVVQASALRWAVHHAIQLRGQRVHANGLGIYQTLETAGGDAERDPDTRQPYYSVVITALATTMAVAS